MIHLVLQHQAVPRLKAAQSLLNLPLLQGLVGTPVKEDAVFSLGRYLNDRASLGLAGGKQKLRVYPVFPQQLPQSLPALSHAAAVVYLGPGPGQGNGLVKPLAARVQGHRAGAEGLAGTNKAVHLIDVVQVEGTKVKYFHGMELLSGMV